MCAPGRGVFRRADLRRRIPALPGCGSAANCIDTALTGSNRQALPPMENVVLTVHLLLAMSLIGVVLLQRSEGGGLGMGGGGGGITGRAAATALGKVTWVLAAAFITTSLTLTILAAQQSTGSSVLDRLGETEAPAEDAQEAPGLPDADDLLPPPSSDAPLTPTAD